MIARAARTRRITVWVYSFLAALILLSAPKAVGAQAPDEPMQASQWMQCWLEQDGLPPSHVRAAQALLGPGPLVTGFSLRVSERLARPTLAGPGAVRVSPALLVAHEVPLWRATLAQGGVQQGRPLSLTHGVNACLPYPVRSIAVAPQPVVRGRTALLTIETDRLAFCRVDYPDHSERCYRDGDSRLYVPLGISALIDPGTYPVRVDLVTGGQEVVFSLALEVRSGNYGFQFIDPPPALSGLIDPELMSSEATYLERWRSLRSPERLWELPLSLPLPRAMPVSADFGDRRSYGGMVSGYHSGVDFRAWTGVPVAAPADGVVVMAEPLATRGNAVLLDHGGGLITGYWHLSVIDVRVGNSLSRGQVFAEVGNTGLSTGAHLHWEVWSNGVSVDGAQWLQQDAFPGMSLAPALQGSAQGPAQ